MHNDCLEATHQLHGGVPHIARHKLAAPLNQRDHGVDVPLHVRVEPAQPGRMQEGVNHMLHHRVVCYQHM